MRRRQNFCDAMYVLQFIHDLFPPIKSLETNSCSVHLSGGFGASSSSFSFLMSASPSSHLQLANNESIHLRSSFLPYHSKNIDFHTVKEFTMNRFIWVSAVLLSFLVQTEALVAFGTRTRTRSSSHRRRNRPLVVANSNAPSSQLHPPSISNLDHDTRHRSIPLYTVSSEFLHQESSLKEQHTKRRRRT